MAVTTPVTLSNLKDITSTQLERNLQRLNQVQAPQVAQDQMKNQPVNSYIGLFSQGLQGMGNALTAGDVRETKQSNLDAAQELKRIAAAQNMEQTQYNRGQDVISNQMAQDRLGMDKERLNISKQDANSRKASTDLKLQQASDMQARGEFENQLNMDLQSAINPLDAAREQNKIVAANAEKAGFTFDPKTNTYGMFDATGNPVALDPATQQQLDQVNSSFTPTNLHGSPEEFKKKLLSYQEKGSKTKSLTDDLSVDKINELMNKYESMVQGTYKLSKPATDELTGLLQSNQKAMQKDLVAAKLDTPTQLMNDLELYDKSRAEGNIPDYISEFVNGLEGVDPDDRDHPRNTLITKFTEWTKAQDGTKGKDSSTVVPPAYRDLVLQQALKEVMVDTGTWYWNDANDNNIDEEAFLSSLDKYAAEFNKAKTKLDKRNEIMTNYANKDEIAKLKTFARHGIVNKDLTQSMDKLLGK